MSTKEVTCGIEGCDNSPGLMMRYCSPTHRQAGLKHAAKVLEAFQEGEDPPEKPTVEEIEKRRERASKWTPERMNERIEELTSKN